LEKRDKIVMIRELVYRIFVAILCRISLKCLRAASWLVQDRPFCNTIGFAFATRPPSCA
jgi:hypothetical protein